MCYNFYVCLLYSQNVEHTRYSLIIVLQIRHLRKKQVEAGEFLTQPQKKSEPRKDERKLKSQRHKESWCRGAPRENGDSAMTQKDAKKVMPYLQAWQRTVSPARASGGLTHMPPIEENILNRIRRHARQTCESTTSLCLTPLHAS